MPEPKERPKKTEKVRFIENYGDMMIVFPVSFAAAVWIFANALAVIARVIH